MNDETCKDCIHSEICYKDKERRHCNIFDMSFDKDAWCEDFKMRDTKDKK